MTPLSVGTDDVTVFADGTDAVARFVVYKDSVTV